MSAIQEKKNTVYGETLEVFPLKVKLIPTLNGCSLN